MASKKPSGLGRGLGALLGDDVMKTESSGKYHKTKVKQTCRLK